jgi:hypothetical protein
MLNAYVIAGMALAATANVAIVAYLGEQRRTPVPRRLMAPGSPLAKDLALVAALASSAWVYVDCDRHASLELMSPHAVAAGLMWWAWLRRPVPVPAPCPNAGKGA